MNTRHLFRRNLLLPALTALTCIVSASAAFAHPAALHDVLTSPPPLVAAAAPAGTMPAATATTADTRRPAVCDTAADHAALGGAQRVTRAPGVQVASPTDIRHCSLVCSSGGGCEYVCRHLVW